MRKHILPVVVLLVGLLMARQLYPYVSGNDPKVVDGYEVNLSDLQPWGTHVFGMGQRFTPACLRP